MWECHYPLTPTHCRKTKGGAGVRTRTFTGICQETFASAKAPAPVCPGVYIYVYLYSYLEPIRSLNKFQVRGKINVAGGITRSLSLSLSLSIYIYIYIYISLYFCHEQNREDLSLYAKLNILSLSQIIWIELQRKSLGSASQSPRLGKTYHSVKPV